MTKCNLERLGGSSSLQNTLLQLGYMKNENNGKIMKDFIGLRAKMFSIDVQNSEVIKKAKGVKASAIRNLSLSNYRDCLLQKKDFLHSEKFPFQATYHIYSNY